MAVVIVAGRRVREWKVRCSGFTSFTTRFNFSLDGRLTKTFDSASQLASPPTTLKQALNHLHPRNKTIMRLSFPILSGAFLLSSLLSTDAKLGSIRNLGGQHTPDGILHAFDYRPVETFRPEAGEKLLFHKACIGGQLVTENSIITGECQHYGAENVILCSAIINMVDKDVSFSFTTMIDSSGTGELVVTGVTDPSVSHVTGTASYTEEGYFEVKALFPHED